MNGRGWNWISRGLVLGCSLLGLSACATGGAGTEGEGNTVIVVENNLIPPASLRVYAVPEVGGRSLVGVVDPSSTARLRFIPVGAAGQYRFVAETIAGAEIVSNPVTVLTGATIQWDVSANLARIAPSG